MPHPSLRSLVLCVTWFSLLMLLSAGCGKAAAKKDALAKERSRLKPLSIMYGQMGGGGKKGPTEAVFKQFVAKNAITMAGGLEYDTVDDLFISERDGKPYVIFYGERPEGVPPNLVGYEQEGVDGFRYVGFVLGNVEEVDEDEFQTLVPNAP